MTVTELAKWIRDHIVFCYNDTTAVQEEDVALFKYKFAMKKHVSGVNALFGPSALDRGFDPTQRWFCYRFEGIYYFRDERDAVEFKLRFC